jgi:hypothetical protein
MAKLQDMEMRPNDIALETTTHLQYHSWNSHRRKSMSEVSWKTAKIPFDIWHKAKSVAHESGVSLQDVVSNALTREVARMREQKTPLSKTGQTKSRLR